MPRRVKAIVRPINLRKWFPPGDPIGILNYREVFLVFWGARGADEIAHMPSFGAVTVELAKLAARHNVKVVTTMAQAAAPLESIPPPMREAAIAMREGAVRNLRTLVANGVTIVIGADTPADTTAVEAAYLQSLGMFDNATRHTVS